MNLGTVYRVFVRDFRKQQKRITLTIIALCWGTISIMLLLGFGEGLHQQLSLNNKGLGEGIAVVWGGQTSIPYKGMGKGRQIWFRPGDPEYLKATIPAIDEIGAEYHRWGVSIRAGDKVLSEHVNGVTPNYVQMRNFIPQSGGRMINDLDIQLKRRVAFLGSALKERLFGQSDPIGKQVLVQSIPFTVVGVMIKKNQMNAYSGMDQDHFVIPLTTFEAIFGDPYLDNIIYKPTDPTQMKQVEQEVFKLMGARKKFDPNDQRALQVWDLAEGEREMNNVLLGIKIFLGIIGGLTLLIASVGVANIMYVSIKERTREIGIKMAVGARRSTILSQFLLEAVLITFLGGGLGMALSYIATEAFQRVPLESEVFQMMGRPTISLEIGISVIIVLGIMGTLAGFFPALKAASVSPVQSLRYE